jgi:hypothetical protein
MRECQYTLGFIMLEASTPLLEDSRSYDKRLFVDTQLHCFVASRSYRNVRVVERGYLTVGVSEMCDLLKENT